MALRQGTVASALAFNVLGFACLGLTLLVLEGIAACKERLVLAACETPAPNADLHPCGADWQGGEVGIDDFFADLMGGRLYLLVLLPHPLPGH